MREAVAVIEAGKQIPSLPRSAAIVHRVLRAMCLVFGVAVVEEEFDPDDIILDDMDDHHDAGWLLTEETEQALFFVTNDERRRQSHAPFLKRWAAFGQDSISDQTLYILRGKEFLNHPGFEEELVERRMRVLRPMVAWFRALSDCCEVHGRQPKAPDLDPESAAAKRDPVNPVPREVPQVVPEQGLEQEPVPDAEPDAEPDADSLNEKAASFPV